LADAIGGRISQSRIFFFQDKEMNNNKRKKYATVGGDVNRW
jgi:hypothetical protein